MRYLEKPTTNAFQDLTLEELLEALDDATRGPVSQKLLRAYFHEVKARLRKTTPVKLTTCRVIIPGESFQRDATFCGWLRDERDDLAAIVHVPSLPGQSDPRMLQQLHPSRVTHTEQP